MDHRSRLACVTAVVALLAGAETARANQADSASSKPVSGVGAVTLGAQDDVGSLQRRPTDSHRGSNPPLPWAKSIEASDSRPPPRKRRCRHGPRGRGRRQASAGGHDRHGPHPDHRSIRRRCRRHALAAWRPGRGLVVQPRGPRGRTAGGPRRGGLRGEADVQAGRDSRRGTPIRRPLGACSLSLRAGRDPRARRMRATDPPPPPARRQGRRDHRPHRIRGCERRGRPEARLVPIRTGRDDRRSSPGTSVATTDRSAEGFGGRDGSPSTTRWRPSISPPTSRRGARG